LHLTAEQIAAAETSGCHFRPATEAEVQRLSMQRKVFFIAGKPMLATRGDGLMETAGTLQRLIEQGQQVLQYQQQVAPAPEVTAPVAELEVVPAPLTIVATVVAVPKVTETTEPLAAPLAEHSEPAPTPRVPRTRRRVAKPVVVALPDEPPDEPPEEQPEADPVPPAEPNATDEPPAEGQAAPARAGRSRDPRTLRWQTAGAERRGRTASHWTQRTR
jgi:hypothetical protein